MVWWTGECGGDHSWPVRTTKLRLTWFFIFAVDRFGWLAVAVAMEHAILVTWWMVDSLLTSRQTIELVRSVACTWRNVEMPIWWFDQTVDTYSTTYSLRIPHFVSINILSDYPFVFRSFLFSFLSLFIHHFSYFDQLLFVYSDGIVSYLLFIRSFIHFTIYSSIRALVRSKSESTANNVEAQEEVESREERKGEKKSKL